MFAVLRFAAAVAIANVVLFAVAIGTSLWAAQTSIGPVRTGRTVKAVFAAMYAVGISWDQFFLTTDEWQHIARILGLVAIPAVWILPDIVGHVGKQRLVARIQMQGDETVAAINTTNQGAAVEMGAREEAGRVLESADVEAERALNAASVEAARVLVKARQEKNVRAAGKEAEDDP
jgi:hypothetical protein